MTLSKLGIAAISVGVFAIAYVATKLGGGKTKSPPQITPVIDPKTGGVAPPYVDPSTGNVWAPSIDPATGQVVYKDLIPDLTVEDVKNAAGNLGGYWPGGTPGTPPSPSPDVTPTTAEVTTAKTNKAYLDENGVMWDFYGYSDGTWEATITDPSVATPYVRTFHELNAPDVIFMIKSHAQTYYKDGVTLKTANVGLPSSGPIAYVQGAKCGSSPCWILSDPTTAVSVPPNALTSPLKIGDVVTYYLADEVDVKDATYLAIVNAVVTGSKIEDAANVGGRYPIRVTSATLLHGNPPMKMPPIGHVLDQWRFRMVSSNLFA